MRTLRELIEHLERAVERAEEPEWCVLCLSTEEADDLLPELRNAQDAYERDA